MSHVEFETFQEYVGRSELSCTPEKFAELQPHILPGGTPVPEDGTYVELGTGEHAPLAAGETLPGGYWALLGNETVRALIREGVLASAVPTRRPY